MILLPPGLYVPPRITVFLLTLLPKIHACASLAFQLIFTTKIFFILKAKIGQLLSNQSKHNIGHYSINATLLRVNVIPVDHHQHDATLLRVNVTPVDHHSIQTLIPLLTLHTVTENVIIATKRLRLAPICNSICLVIIGNATYT